MTALTWDQPGERVYEAGVDRGVLYTPSHGAVVWNGLISITESVSGNEITPIYFDGVKIANSMSPGDFSGTLRAFTYPDEFLELEGIIDAGNGLFVANQEPTRFGLSYRTKIGDDIDSLNLGYKIHLLYNVTATPSPKNYQTTQGADAIPFEWNISAIPDVIPGYRATAHVFFDTRDMDPIFIKDIENTLYGDETKDAKLPPLSTIINFSSNWVIIRITDNGDGTWTAEGPDDYIRTFEEDESFEIINGNAVIGIDGYTYLISDLTH